jgi:hypothetical protein
MIRNKGLGPEPEGHSHNRTLWDTPQTQNPPKLRKGLNL